MCWRHCAGRSSHLLVDESGDNTLTAAVSGFIGRMLLANADALCAPASPLLPVQHVPQLVTISNLHTVEHSSEICTSNYSTQSSVKNTRLIGLFLRTIWVNRHQKCGTILDVNEARDDVVAVAWAGPYANHLHLGPNRQTCQHLVVQFYRPDSFPDAQPTALKHWRQSSVSSKELVKVATVQ